MATLRRTSAASADAAAREVDAYCTHLNGILAQCGGAQGSRTDIAAYLPLAPETLFERLRDGVLLAHCLNFHFAGAIDPARLIHGLDLGMMDREGSRVTFEVHGNLSALIRAAKDVPGLVLVNIGPQDILDMNRDLVLGLLWQVFNARLTAAISVGARPELLRLVQPGENMAALSALRPEALLVRWANYHLERAGCARRIANLGRDLADGEVYARILREVSGGELSEADVSAVLAEADAGDAGVRLRRAEMVVALAARLGCHEFAAPQDIASGHPRLNFALMATIFNRRLGITLPSQEEVDGLAGRLRTTDAQLQSAGERVSALESELATVRSQMESVQQELLAAKEELAAERASRETVTAAMFENERQRHQDELWALLGRQQVVREQLLSVARLLRDLSVTGTEDSTASVLGSVESMQTLRLSDNASEAGAAAAQAACDPVGIEGVARMLSAAAQAVAVRVQAADVTLGELHSTVARKERVNEIMGEKIREYTEQMISGGSSRRGSVSSDGQQRRGSILRRIFPN